MSVSHRLSRCPATRGAVPILLLLLPLALPLADLLRPFCLLRSSLLPSPKGQPPWVSMLWPYRNDTCLNACGARMVQSPGVTANLSRSESLGSSDGFCRLQPGRPCMLRHLLHLIPCPFRSRPAQICHLVSYFRKLLGILQAPPPPSTIDTSPSHDQQTLLPSQLVPTRCYLWHQRDVNFWSALCRLTPCRCHRIVLLSNREAVSCSSGTNARTQVDSWFGSLPSVFRRGHGSYELPISPVFACQAALHCGLFWLHYHDPRLRDKGTSFSAGISNGSLL